MEILIHTPVLIKVLATLGLILAVNHATKRLLPAVIAGTLALGLWCGFSLSQCLSISWERAGSLDNLMLLLVVTQVIWLSEQMKQTGITRELISSLGNRFERRTVIAALPAVIGMLPMPGGSLFSAPMVDGCDPEGRLPAELKGGINYWFRHVWEYWWPMYPGVLLAIDLTGLEIWQFMLLQIPMTFVSVAVGCCFLLRHVPRRTSEKRKKEDGVRSLALLMSPILVTIGLYGLIKALYALLGLYLPELPQMQKYLPMSIGLIFATAMLQHRTPLPGSTWKAIILSRSTLWMMLLVASIRVYGAFIEARLPGGIFLADAVRSELGAYGIPVWMVVAILPFVAGFSTGIALGFVGASFPVVMRIIGQDPSSAVLLSTTVLAYGAGYAGMLLSPVHLCLLVSNQHFKLGLAKSLLRLLLPCAAIVACAALYCSLISALWPG